MAPDTGIAARRAPDRHARWNTNNILDARGVDLRDVDGQLVLASTDAWGRWFVTTRGGIIDTEDAVATCGELNRAGALPVAELPSWCTWHGSDGTCVEHRPCFCGRRPILFDADNRSYCMEHARWDASLGRWLPAPEGKS